jgi:hypothetical protein
MARVAVGLLDLSADEFGCVARFVRARALDALSRTCSALRASVQHLPLKVYRFEPNQTYCVTVRRRDGSLRALINCRVDRLRRGSTKVLWARVSSHISLHRRDGRDATATLTELLGSRSARRKVQQLTLVDAELSPAPGVKENSCVVLSQWLKGDERVSSHSAAVWACAPRVVRA